MRPRTLGFNVLVDGIQERVDNIEINVNGGYTIWNRWTEHRPGQAYFLGIDLCREATIARNQSINCSTVPGTLISRLKGKTNG